MKKLLAVLMCIGLICGMGVGLVGCENKPAATKDKDKDKDKDAKDKDAKEKDKDKK